MVTLRPVTTENLKAILAMETRPEQASFVSSNAVSLAQAYVYSQTAYPFAIYAGETPVGFIMLGYYEARNQYTLWKLLIARHHQHKGYGRAALLKGIDFLRREHGAGDIYTGVSPGNEIAKALYRSVGFRETGLTEFDMIEMRLVYENNGL